MKERKNYFHTGTKKKSSRREINNLHETFPLEHLATLKWQLPVTYTLWQLFLLRHVSSYQTINNIPPAQDLGPVSVRTCQLDCRISHLFFAFHQNLIYQWHPISHIAIQIHVSSRCVSFFHDTRWNSVSTQARLKRFVTFICPTRRSDCGTVVWDGLTVE